MNELHRTVDATWTLGITEFGAGIDLARRKTQRRRYLATTVFGLFILALAVFVAAVTLVVGRDANTEVAVNIAPITALYALALLPWTRSRLFGAVLWLGTRALRQPSTLVSYGADGMRFRSGLGESLVRYGAYRFRFATRRLFVFVADERALPLVLPRRVFPTADEADAFERVAIDAPSSPVVGEAVFALESSEDPLSTEYTLTPDEHLRGMRILLRNASVGGALVAIGWKLVTPVILVVASVSFVRTDGVLAGVLFATFMAAVFAFARYRVRTILRERLRPTRLHIDASGVTFETAQARGTIRPDGVKTLVESDGDLLVLVTTQDVGYFVPRRAIDSTRLAALRRALGRETRGD